MWISVWWAKGPSECERPRGETPAIAAMLACRPPALLAPPAARPRPTVCPHTHLLLAPLPPPPPPLTGPELRNAR